MVKIAIAGGTGNVGQEIVDVLTANITDFVRTKVANQRNSILITYALTQKASQLERYNLFVYLAVCIERDDEKGQ
ncbi:uncharacterized protein ALTATR162_LOCUS10635 [Alternaria atra]|uniref:Uncharacterized protein n=1 Tax=Alternaria atra TaxID=119953 RepID=A0A8J2I9V7_9PLEO|nr:uncharacterized protein ALTATR162_LOCUS10635 [Alternaria atra]CAG5183547.1 unnamed protein product [Alternaria atra]